MLQTNLTMMQRIQLDALLSVQRGTLDDLFSLHEIREKLKMTRALREKYTRVVGNGLMVDEEACAIADSMQVEFESEHVRRLQKLLKEWNQFTPVDLVWINPLRTALEEVDGVTSMRKKVVGK
jgi:hypothetical protein